MRKGELILNYFIVIAPIILSVGISWSLGVIQQMPQVAYWSMLLLFLFGFISFAKSKHSVISQGKLFTFGSSSMTKSNRVAYFVGYILMAIGFILLISFTITGGEYVTFKP